MVQNGSYLEAHQILCQKAKKNNGPIHENSQRYMYISRAEFKNSLTRNHTYAINIALDFLYWHAINGVDLYRIDKTTADEIFKNRDLPVSDIGLWKNKFAVFFYKPAYPERTHKMNGHYSWKERYINIVFNVEGRDSREYSTLHNIEDAYRCLERHVKSNKKDIIISADNYKGMSGEDRIKDKVKNEIKDLLKYL
jgi:hypothetical protein